MSSDNRQGDILIYDSGLGGLSVAKHIRDSFPEASFIYFADHAGFPYGSLSEDDLLRRVVDNVRRLSKHFDFKLLVLACNTASTLVLPKLRSLLHIEVVGVVPAIKPAALISQSKRIGLLATPATVSRSYTDQLIGEFAADCQVLRLGTRRLVEIAEDKLFGRKVSINEISCILAPFFTRPAEIPDVIVLACTHFPLLKDELTEVTSDYPLIFVDSGEAIARRVVQLLPETSSLVGKTSFAITTAPADLLNDVSKVFLDFGYYKTYCW